MGTLGRLAKGAIPAVITGVRALGMALMTNPIGLIIGGIALAAGLIFTYWEPIKTFFSGLWDGVKAVFSSTWEWIKGLFFRFHPLGLVIKHWEPITGFFIGMWDNIKAIFGQAWEWIKTVIVAPLLDVGGTVVSFIGGLFSSDEPEQDSPADDAGQAEGTAATTRQVRPNIGAAHKNTPVSADTVMPGAKLPAPANAQQNTVTNHSNYAISVQPAPGMDERQLAALVGQEMDKRDRRAAADRNRSMYDGG